MREVFALQIRPEVPRDLVGQHMFLGIVGLFHGRAFL